MAGPVYVYVLLLPRVMSGLPSTNKRQNNPRLARHANRSRYGAFKCEYQCILPLMWWSKFTIPLIGQVGGESSPIQISQVEAIKHDYMEAFVILVFQ